MLHPRVERGCSRENTRDKEFHVEPNLRCVYARETKMAIVISLRLIHVNYDRDAAKKGRHWMKNCFLATGHLFLSLH